MSRYREQKEHRQEWRIARRLLHFLCDSVKDVTWGTAGDEAGKAGREQTVEGLGGQDMEVGFR